jgi:hypothetical protein
MFLTDKFIERPRPHPRRERRARLRRVVFSRIDIFFFEQVLHEAKLRRAIESRIFV